MKKKFWTILGLALGALVLGVVVGLMTVGTVAADPTPGVRIQIPRIDVGDVLGTGRWETWIQVQNVSLPDLVTGKEPDTGAIFFGWGEYSELCPSNAPGPIVHYCQLIRGNALWTLKNQLPDYVVRNGITHTIQTGIIYSVRADVFQEACDAAGWAEGNTHRWLEWEKEWRNGNGQILDPVTGLPHPAYGDFGGTTGAPGEDLAVTVTRYGPNDYGTFVSSTYTGISEEMEGEDHPYEYYAPYIMKGYNGLDTELTIQNSGEMCTSVWINYMEQGSCRIVYKYHVEQLAPGEAVRLKAPCNIGQIECGWLGSAHITAEMPLGIIVDETSFDEICPDGVDRGTLLTHRARPKIEKRDGVEIKDYKVYADLLFREWSGWESSIQVQNLSRTGQNTFVTVDFMDNSGDEILFLADWVCPGGSATFYLPVVYNLGFDYVGAAEIQSHSQVSYPGGETDAQPIFAVVDLKKPDDPRTPALDAQGGSYNAHPESQKEWVSQIALPFMAKDASDLYTPWTSLIAIRNNSNCNKIKPEIHFKDETGTVVCKIHSFWLRPKHVKMFDLNDIGCLYPGYVGAARVYVEEFEQLCDVNQDGRVDNLPLMPSVIVVERGHYGSGIDGGDVTNIYEGIPYATNIPACKGDLFGTVSVRQENHGFDRAEINGAIVSTDTLSDTTDSTGGYQITGIPLPGDTGEGTVAMTVTKDGFFDGPQSFDEAPPTAYCGDDTMQNFELICQSTLNVTVTDTGGNPIPGATVTVTGTYEYNADTEESKTDISDLTDSAGQVTMKVAGATTVLTGTATAPGHDPSTIIEPGYPDPNGTEYNDHCGDTELLEFVGTTGLCKHAIVVGRVTIGGQSAEGYTVKVLRMSDLTVVDKDVTTATGVYAVEGLSVALGPGYRLQLYSPSGSLVSSSATFTVVNPDNCGDTGVADCVNGVWPAAPIW